MKRLYSILRALSLATCCPAPAVAGESPGGVSEADVIFDTALCNENYDYVLFVMAGAAVNTQFPGYLPHIIRTARLTGCNEYNKALRSNRRTGAFAHQIGRDQIQGKSRIYADEFTEVGFSHFAGDSCFVQELNKNNRLPIINSQNLLDAVAVEGYSGVLSQTSSVTPQRHCGFFAPEIRPASQAGFDNGASAAASHLRLQSVYDGMTPQNTTPFTGNMGGGSRWPRVNPVTHSGAQPERVNTQKHLGAAHHG